MKTKHIIGLGLLLILITLILLIATHSMSGSSAAYRQDITPAPSPTATLPAIVLESTPVPTPEIPFTGTVEREPIPLCTFDVQAQPPSSTTSSLDSYLFSEPRVVLTSTTPIRLYQWLPDGRRWLIGRAMTGVAGEYIETFDLDTGEIRRCAERRSSAGKPVWLPSEQAVAFVDSMPPDYTWILYLGRGSDLPVEELARDLANPLLSLSQDGQQLIYAVHSRGIRAIRLQGSLDSSSLIADLPGQTDTGWAYSDAWRADGTMASVYVYRPGMFYLIDRVTGTMCSMDLGQIGAGEHSKVRASDMTWSADGRYLAMRMVYGDPERFLGLRIIDTLTKDFRDISFDGMSARNIDWLPDGNILLATVDINPDPSKGNFDGLYLVDAATGDVRHMLPEYQFFAAHYFGTLWSPDSHSIGIPCSEVVLPDQVLEWRVCAIVVEGKR